MGQLIGLTIAAVPALLAPVILLGGIYTGVFTPTEAAAVATLYALLLAFLVYRSMTLKALWRVLQVSVRQSSVVMVVIGGAFLVNYIVATEGIPQVAAAWLLSVTSDPLPLVILIMAVFLIIGMFLDGTLILLIMVPVVLPALTAAGVDLVYFGILIVFNLMIGMCTPPFGLLLFVVSTTTRTPLRDIITEIRPQLGVMLIALLVLTLVPELTLWVPHLMGYEG
jgi:tripartite ATP-independent transporter DctM subunit